MREKMIVAFVLSLRHARLKNLPKEEPQGGGRDAQAAAALSYSPVLKDFLSPAAHFSQRKKAMRAYHRQLFLESIHSHIPLAHQVC